MKLSKLLVPVTTTLFLASAANAQVLTEVRTSTSGTDWEYVEIEGTPGQSTDGLMILVVESDDFSSSMGPEPGILDEVYDLSGNSFGITDQFFVFGSFEAEINLPAGTIDLAVGDNLFENSSYTLYLVSVPDQTKRDDLDLMVQGTDVRTAPGATTTILANDPGITILDVVALNDGGTGDTFFDGAPAIGPEPQGFLPAGVIRNGGCPGDWCTDQFVDFSNNGTGAMFPFVDPTPGAVNPTTSCATTPAVGVCGGTVTVGTSYCMANANSTGVASGLIGTGSTLIAANNLELTATDLPTSAFGFFLASRDQGFVANPGGSAGNLCLSGSIGRYVGPGQIQNSGAAGEFSLALDLTMIPQPSGFVAIVGGETWNFQAWFRDAVGGTPTSNFTTGLEISFQ